MQGRAALPTQECPQSLQLWELQGSLSLAFEAQVQRQRCKLLQLGQYLKDMGPRVIMPAPFYAIFVFPELQTPAPGVRSDD